jgi:AdoMet-dependent rRNA methyltransferase SPB1
MSFSVLHLSSLTFSFRWSFNDDNLPSWFAEDEAKCYQRTIPVTKEQVREYQARMKEINARPIKKIAEAKGRKKRKV